MLSIHLVPALEISTQTFASTDIFPVEFRLKN